jgi:hypothetical protein
MTSVTIERIKGVRRDIADAVNQTSPGSTLPNVEQDRLLAQACTETCQLLTDWVDSTLWQALDLGEDAPLAEVFQDQQPLVDLLGDLFGDALERTLDRRGDADGSAQRLTAARTEAERAVQAALESSLRYPRMRCGQLLKVAVDRVRNLQQEVCELAGEISIAREQGREAASATAQRADRVRRIRAALIKASGFLLTLTVSVAGPGQALHNLSAWTDEVKVVIVHDLAAQAQPTLRITPPSAGPRIR